MKIKFNGNSEIYDLDTEVVDGKKVVFNGNIPETIDNGFSFVDDDGEPYEIYDTYRVILERDSNHAILSFKTEDSQLDRIEAQTLWTALMTDTLLEEE